MDKSIQEMQEYEQSFDPKSFAPMFANAGEFWEVEDVRKAEELQELEDEARRRIAELGDDPRSQSYFMRLDSKTVVKDEQEYVACQKRGIPMQIVNYSHAASLLANEDARKRQKLKARQKSKAARSARKKGRK